MEHKHKFRPSLRAALSNKAQGSEQQPSEEIPQALPTLLSFLLSLLLLFIPGPLKNRFDTVSKPAPALQQETGRKLLLQLLSLVHLHDSSYCLVFTSIPVASQMSQCLCDFPQPWLPKELHSTGNRSSSLTPDGTAGSDPQPQTRQGARPQPHITGMARSHRGLSPTSCEARAEPQTHTSHRGPDLSPTALRAPGP